MAEWGLVSWAPRSVAQEVSRTEERRSKPQKIAIGFIWYAPIVQQVVFSPRSGTGDER